MPPKLSIIVPNYNHSRYLEKRLQSILSQTFEDLEVIILDDKSTDNSLEVISNFAGNKKITQLVVNATNSGSPFIQWNKGIELAQGDYIWIAESDDYAHEEFLSHLIPLLDAHPRVGIAYCQSVTVRDHRETDLLTWWTDDLDRERWRAPYIETGRTEVNRYACQRNTIMNASSAVFRKKAYIDAHIANEAFRLCGDWLTWVSMMKDWDVAFCPLPLNYYRFHDKTVRGQAGQKLVFLECLQVRAYIWKHFDLPMASRLALIRGLASEWKNYLIHSSSPSLVASAVKSVFRDFWICPSFLAYLFYAEVRAKLAR